MGCMMSEEKPKPIPGGRKSEFQRKHRKAATSITVGAYQEGKYEDLIETIKSVGSDLTDVFSITAMDIGDGKVQSVTVFKSMAALEENSEKIKEALATVGAELLTGPPERITGEVYTACGMTDFANGAESEAKAAASMTTIKLKPEGVAPSLEIFDKMQANVKQWPGFIGMSVLIIEGTTVKSTVLYESMWNLTDNSEKVAEIVRQMKDYFAEPPERVVGEVGYAFTKTF